MEDVKEIIDIYNESLKNTGIVYYYKVTYLNFYKDFGHDTFEENIPNFLCIPYHNRDRVINFTLPPFIEGDLKNLQEFQIFNVQKNNYYWYAPIFSCSVEYRNYPSVLSPPSIVVNSNILHDPLAWSNSGNSLSITLSENDTSNFPWGTPLSLRILHFKNWEKIKSTINTINVNPDLRCFPNLSEIRYGFPIGQEDKLKLDYAIKVEVVMGKDFYKGEDISQLNDIEISKVIYDISNDFDKVVEKLQALRTMIELTAG